MRLKPDDIKKEYLLPELVDQLIKTGRAQVDVLETKDTWFGVTYQEDKETVMEALGSYRSGVYKSLQKLSNTDWDCYKSTR